MAQPVSSAYRRTERRLEEASSPVYWAPYCSCPLTPDYGRLALALGELYQMSEGE